MNLFNYIQLLSLGLLLVSCEEEIENAKTPNFVEKLVVTSYISPQDTVIQVYISKNRPVYGKITDPVPISEADVVLSDNNNQIQLLNSGPNIFSISSKAFLLKDNKNYKLSVKTPDGLFVEAECTMPAFRDLKLIADSTRVIEKTDWGTYSYLKYSIKFTDFPGERNYYRVIVSLVYYSKQYVGTQPMTVDKEFLTDNGKDGKDLVTTTTDNGYIDNYMDSVFLKVSILNTSYEYYKFHQTLSSYDGSDDPFTEIVQVYSNITGGLGIFGAFTSNELMIRVK